MKKTIFLILTLAIPVSIFLFLKIFGINTFEVPLLFEDGIPDCANTIRPHLVPDIAYTADHGEKAHLNDAKGFLVFGVLNPENPEKVKEQLVELVRIQDAFFEIGSPYFVVFYYGDSSRQGGLRSLCDTMGLNQKNSSVAFLDRQDLDTFLTCGIALKNDDSEQQSNLVLVDAEKRIRGVYNGLDVEETDQLILELKILKKEK